MIEAVKHVFGFCGENHPHILNISAIGVGAAGYFLYIKLYLKSKIKLWIKM